MPQKIYYKSVSATNIAIWEISQQLNHRIELLELKNFQNKQADVYIIF